MHCIKFFLFTTLCCLIGVNVTYADQRSGALASLAKLRQEGVASKLPDEMRSLDATLATADMYYQFHDQKNADRYYQLATQKIALIQQRLQAPPVPALQPAVTVPPLQSKTAPTAPAAPAQIVLEPASSSSLPQAATEQPANAAAALEPLEEFGSDRLVGTAGTYTVLKGESLRLVAAKLGVSKTQLAAMNNLGPKDTIKAGQILRYNNQRIIPAHRLRDGIVINIPDRMLYLYQHGNLTFSTAVALGTPTKTKQFVWQTPTGKFKIVNKAKDPTWTVPPSIMEEMRLEGKEVITSIPPGPTNPLGKYAMKTSLPGILIHSTTKPWSIYTYASHGCIRVFPQRMEELFKLVTTNTPGEIIYKPVKLAVTDDGKILLEAHGDIYNKTRGLESEAQALIRAHKLDGKVDWEKVKRVISRKAGVAEEITRISPEEKTVNTASVQSPS
jgi:lipoprotein-anchoring transpeptidase ErfK/SrfK